MPGSASAAAANDAKTSERSIRFNITSSLGDVGFLASRYLSGRRRKWCFPGVVAVDPVDVCDPFAPDVLARADLHPGGALLACRLVATQSGLDAFAIAVFETARQDRSVLD